MVSTLHTVVLAVTSAYWLLAASTANAAPTTYEITPTDTGGSTSPTGSFTYDGTTETFSNFIVHYDGRVVDFSAASNVVRLSFEDCADMPSNTAVSRAGVIAPAVAATSEKAACAIKEMILNFIYAASLKGAGRH